MRNILLVIIACVFFFASITFVESQVTSSDPVTIVTIEEKVPEPVLQHRQRLFGFLCAVSLIVALAFWVAVLIYASRW